jgi:hypothetical protein
MSKSRSDSDIKLCGYLDVPTDATLDEVFELTVQTGREAQLLRRDFHGVTL